MKFTEMNSIEASIYIRFAYFIRKMHLNDAGDAHSDPFGCENAHRPRLFRVTQATNFLDHFPPIYLNLVVRKTKFFRFLFIRLFIGVLLAFNECEMSYCLLFRM